MDGAKIRFDFKVVDPETGAVLKKVSVEAGSPTEAANLAAGQAGNAFLELDDESPEEK